MKKHSRRGDVSRCVARLCDLGTDKYWKDAASRHRRDAVTADKKAMLQKKRQRKHLLEIRGEHT